jgi:photosystem II stability/assembly factor-like uncharacterized protein
VARVRLALIIAGMMLVAAAPPGRAAVSSGHSGWSWGSPLPQGQTIHAIEFLGSRGYAAGEFGTVLRTDDAGTSWSGLATGTTQSLNRIVIIDADSVVLAGGCTVRRSDDSGQTLKRLPWTASDQRCAAPIAGLAFPSDQRGYLVLDDGTVFQTGDGGQTWSRKTAVPGTKATGEPGLAADLAFTANDTGTAVTTSGRIYRTTDGAASWTLVGQTSQPLRDLRLVDANLVYAVGDHFALKTTNGGATWAEKLVGDVRLTSISCADALTCLVTTVEGDRLLRTTDGAVSFSFVTPSTDKVFAAAFAAAGRAVAAGSFGTTVASNDGGATWAPVGGRLSGSFGRLRATSSSLAFAAGREGTIARTTDGGATWSTIGVSTAEDLYDVSFVSREIGFALDTTGSVLRTDNAGASWQILNTGTSSRPQAILAPSAGVVLLIGPRAILRSTDGGGEFSRVRGRRVRTKLFNADRGGNSIFAYGSKNMIVSTDRGKSWRKVRLPRRTLLSAVDFVTSRVGFALGQDGRVFKTRNRGKRWSDLSALGSDDGVGLSFDSPSKGYVVLSRFGDDASGFVLRTGDGGRSWRPQLVTNSPILGDGIAAAGATDFLLANGSSFFFTTSGGDRGAPSAVKIKTRRKRVRRRTTIRIAGRIPGAAPGSSALVARRQIGESGWDYEVAKVASNGTFTTTWKVTKTATFVAQWIGDDDQAGDGSRPLTVRLRR